MSILASTHSGKEKIYPRVTFEYLKSLGWHDSFCGYVDNKIEKGPIKRKLCDPKLGWTYSISMEGDIAYGKVFFGWSTETHKIGYYNVLIEYMDELELYMEYMQMAGEKEKIMAEHIYKNFKKAKGIIREPMY